MTTGMDWLCPGYNEVLARQLTAYHGNITAENTIHNIVSIVQTGDLHIAVYDLPNEILFVSNTRAASESGPFHAYDSMQCRMREGRREGKEGGGRGRREEEGGGGRGGGEEGGGGGRVRREGGKWGGEEESGEEAVGGGGLRLEEGFKRREREEEEGERRGECMGRERVEGDWGLRRGSEKYEHKSMDALLAGC